MILSVTMCLHTENILLTIICNRSITLSKLRTTNNYTELQQLCVAKLGYIKRNHLLTSSLKELACT